MLCDVQAVFLTAEGPIVRNTSANVEMLALIDNVISFCSEPLLSLKKHFRFKMREVRRRGRESDMQFYDIALPNSRKTSKQWKQILSLNWYVTPSSYFTSR